MRIRIRHLRSVDTLKLPESTAKMTTSLADVSHLLDALAPDLVQAGLSRNLPAAPGTPERKPGRPASEHPDGLPAR
jgi:hypothetical protein